jgi:hypothetical protein
MEQVMKYILIKTPLGLKRMLWLDRGLVDDVPAFEQAQQEGIQKRRMLRWLAKKLEGARMELEKVGGAHSAGK